MRNRTTVASAATLIVVVNHSIATLDFSPPTVTVSGGDVDLTFAAGHTWRNFLGKRPVIAMEWPHLPHSFLSTILAEVLGFSGEVTETETITLGSPTTATVNGQYRGPAPAL